jgi:predicted RNase H-like HicB family nuclease
MKAQASVVRINGSFVATYVTNPKIKATGQSKEEAISRLKGAILEDRSEPEIVEFDLELDPLAKHAQYFRDDPTLDEIVKEAYHLRKLQRIEEHGE